MKIDAQFVKAISEACEAALVRHGFSRLRRDGVVFPISDDFVGWAGLNVGKHEGYVRINPFIGIHCIPVMKLVAELSGERYQKGRFATFAVHMGEVCPNIETFDFTDRSKIGSEADRLASTYESCGVPFMLDHASYEALLPILKSRISMLGGFPQRYAAALYLLGRRDEARKFVTERVEEYEDEDDAVRQSFDLFAKPFLRLVSH